MRLVRTEIFGQQQRTRARRNHAQAVSRRVGRRHGRLHRTVLRRTFNAVGINHNILRGGGKAQKHRARRHRFQAACRRRVGKRHQQYRCNNQDLRKKQPASALPQPRQQRQRQRINQRRPHKFERIAQRRPTEHRYLPARHPRLQKPERQRGKNQQKRNARRKTQQQKINGAAVKKSRRRKHFQKAGHQNGSRQDTEKSEII